jgi:hypothetical protein
MAVDSQTGTNHTRRANHTHALIHGVGANRCTRAIQHGPHIHTHTANLRAGANHAHTFIHGVGAKHTHARTHTSE